MEASSCIISTPMTGQGELDIDKLNESSNITVDDYEIEDQDCESCTI